MPVQRCQKNGRRGYKFGSQGACYVGRGAKAKAERQGRAIRASGYRG
jgi:hypothetical protein